MTRRTGAGRTARKVQRDAYLISRGAGDLAAFQSGGLPRYLKRRTRRGLTAAIFRAIRNLDK